MIDPAWEKIHSTRSWVSLPQEEMVKWLGNKFGGSNDRKNIKVLDLGCGQGPSTIFLSQMGFNVVAVDGSPSALDRLEENLAHYKVHVDDIVLADIAKVPYPDEYFDIVIDIASICMNNSCQEIFDEAARLLKPEGSLFSVLAATDTNKRNWEGFGAVTYFDPDKINECLSNKFSELIVAYKCVELLDKSFRTSHWLVMAVKSK